MKNFLKNCIFFSLPVAALLLFPLWVFIISGEILTPQAVFGRQEKNSEQILFQSAYTVSTEKPYKLFAAEKTRPELLILGVSRALTFRKDFFKEGTSFYNAGRGISDADDLTPFLLRMPQDLDVVIFDASSFWNEGIPVKIEERDSPYEMFQLFATSGWRQVYLDYIQKKFSIRDIIKKRKTSANIGLSAIIHGNGYRLDGSLDRGNDIEAIEKRKMPEALSAQSKDNIIALGQAYSPSTLHIAEIEKFLAQAKKRNVYVIGYLSPYATEIYKGIISREDTFGENFRVAEPLLTAVFRDHGFPFYDLRNLETFGSSNAELYDAEHPTEKGTLKLLGYMADREPKLKKYVDLGGFKQKIDKEKF